MRPLPLEQAGLPAGPMAALLQQLSTNGFHYGNLYAAYDVSDAFKIDQFGVHGTLITPCEAIPPTNSGFF